MRENVKTWFRDLFNYEIETTEPTINALKDELAECTDPVEKAQLQNSIAELEEFLQWVNNFKKQTEEA